MPLFHKKQAGGGQAAWSTTFAGAANGPSIFHEYAAYPIFQLSGFGYAPQLLRSMPYNCKLTLKCLIYFWPKSWPKCLQ